MLDARTEARAGAALMAAATGAGRDEWERAIALSALEQLSTEEGDRFWIARYEGSAGEDRGTYAQQAARRVAMRSGWGVVERMIASEADELARGTLIASYPGEAAHPPEMLAWLERAVRTERDPWVRSTAIGQLVHFGPDARPILEEARKDGDWQVSGRAEEVLRALGTP